MGVNGKEPAERKQVIIRLDKEVLQRVDMMAVRWDGYRSETVERLLIRALDEVEKQKVFA